MLKIIRNIDNMSEESFMIKKIFNSNGKKRHVLMTNGNSEVFERIDKIKIGEMVNILNDNTDSGCKYEIITILNK